MVRHRANIALTHHGLFLNSQMPNIHNLICITFCGWIKEKRNIKKGYNCNASQKSDYYAHNWYTYKDCLVQKCTIWIHVWLVAQVGR